VNTVLLMDGPGAGHKLFFGDRIRIGDIVRWAETPKFVPFALVDRDLNVVTHNYLVRNTEVWEAGPILQYCAYWCKP
jgi:hypothetical protein